MGNWLPKTLAHGRLRMSTVLLSLLFGGVLVLYLFVRPPPVTVDRTPDPTGQNNPIQTPATKVPPSATPAPDKGESSPTPDDEPTKGKQPSSPAPDREPSPDADETTPPEDETTSPEDE